MDLRQRLRNSATGFLFGAIILTGLAACRGHDEDDKVAEHVNATRKIWSPNGEPLNGGSLGHPACRDALGAWFDRVDTNHDGILDFDEYMADAKRQFAAMNLNKDGMLTPAELADYRAPFGPAPGFAPLSEAIPRKKSGDEDSAESRRRSGKGNIGGDLPDPVMLADTKQRNVVSLGDFLAYEKTHFAELDVNHDGKVQKAEVLQDCDQK